MGKYHLTLAEKLSIIEFHDKHPDWSIRHKTAVLSLKMQRSLGKSTLNKILKQRDLITQSKDKKLTNVRVANNDVMEFERRLAADISEHFVNCNITSSIVKLIAADLQKEECFASTNVAKMKFSNDWWTKFAVDYKFSYKRVQGGMKVVSKAAIDAEMVRILAACVGYTDENIWNCDEAGFFTNQVSNYSYSTTNGNPVGRQLNNDLNSKVRITTMHYISRDGKIAWTPSFILKNFPRGFQRKNDWTHGKAAGRFCDEFRAYRNPRAWMTKSVFQKEMNLLNDKMKDEKRKILLILDNAPGHDQELQLSNIIFLFLLPNTTSILQPLDQGVIAVVKAKYKVWFNICLFNKEVPGKIEKMMKIVNITNEVTENTILYCWKKAGLLPTDPDLTGVEEEIAETDNDLNLIENAAIFSTIYDEIVEEDQPPILDDDMIELELVPTDPIANVPDVVAVDGYVLSPRKRTQSKITAFLR